MEFLIDRGEGTDLILAKLRDLFLLNVEAAAAHANLFNPANGYRLSYIANQIGALPGSGYDQDWIGWLDDIYVRHQKVHDKIRNKMYRHLTRTPPRPMLHDWEESSAGTTPEFHFLDDFPGKGRFLHGYMRVRTPRFTPAKKRQYKEVAAKKAEPKTKR